MCSRIWGIVIGWPRIFEKGRKVLFSGVSCQIAGLHRFLRKEYENLLTVDVICHGVPSPLVWRKYVEAIQACPLGIAGGKWILSSLNEIPVITSITFRDKSTGWKNIVFPSGDTPVVRRS